MALYDQHLHSHFSFDSQADPRDMVLAAVRQGLAGLTFTEHFDTHPNEWPRTRSRYDYQRYTHTIAELRAEFGRQIWIGQGIEVCYQPQRMPTVLDFLSNHRFDVVVLSVHWAAGWEVYRREYWDHFGLAVGVETYLQAVLEAARFCLQRSRHGERPFDVLGHLDLAKRYTHRFLGQVTVAEHLPTIDEILWTCLEAGLVPEINTSSARGPIGEPMPGRVPVQRYAELGGSAVSLGSDAHTPDAVGVGLVEAAQMSRSVGISRMAVFRDRVLQTVPLA